MVIVVGPAETAESVRELNFLHEFEIGEIHERSVSTIQHQLEQDAEHITHLVYDIRAIGNVDASLALLGRICTTIPGITGKTIVVTEGIAGSSSFMRDVCEMYPKEQIVQSHGAELKRVLNAMLCADGIIRTERSATCSAVAGAGHRIGTTTQAMQICLYVKALGYKAAIIEMAASALTGYTQISDDAVLFDEHHFRVEGTDVYNDRTCILDAKSQYDYLILDYGCFAELTEPADYLRNDILVAVCGAKPSEVELAADVLRVDNGTIHYIFSFVPQRDRPDVLASMEQYGERTYFAGWTPDYFLYSGNDELYGKITGQIKPKSKAVQKKSHKWPWRKK